MINHPPRVYLCGPIAGCTYNGCTQWREAVIEDLALAGVKGVSPMRAKDYLAGITNFGTDGDAYGHLSVMSTNRGITTRDRFDATHSDVLLVNFIGATKISVGSVIELGWADSYRVPIVCAMEEGNVHEHGMVLEMIGFKVPTLEEAVHITKAILS